MNINNLYSKPLRYTLLGLSIIVVALFHLTPALQDVTIAATPFFDISLLLVFGIIAFYSLGFVSIVALFPLLIFAFIISALGFDDPLFYIRAVLLVYIFLIPEMKQAIEK